MTLGGDDFDTFKQFLDKFKPDPQAQIVRYREGGDPTDYSIPGNYKYTPIIGVFQVGAAQWTGAAATSGVKGITYPQSFREPPLMIASVSLTWPLFEQIALLVVPGNPYGGTFYWWSVNPLTIVNFHWFAFGPAGA